MKKKVKQIEKLILKLEELDFYLKQEESSRVTICDYIGKIKKYKDIRCELKVIADLKEFAIDSYNVKHIPNFAGVYFLKYRGNIMYVGQSNNVQRRISNHIKSDMVFSSVVLHCLPSCIYNTHDRCKRETYYINQLSPQYNNKNKIDLFDIDIFINRRTVLEGIEGKNRIVFTPTRVKNENFVFNSIEYNLKFEYSFGYIHDNISEKVSMLEDIYNLR